MSNPQEMTSEAILSVNNIEVIYDHVILVLKGVSLHVPKGDPGFKDRIGEVLYNRGMVQAIYVTEGIRAAMRISGRKEITGSDMRDGLEAVDITADRWKELGLDGFSYPVKVTCEIKYYPNGLSNDPSIVGATTIRTTGVE